jgi:hypothetical protein
MCARLTVLSDTPTQPLIRPSETFADKRLAFRIDTVNLKHSSAVDAAIIVVLRAIDLHRRFAADRESRGWSFQSDSWWRVRLRPKALQNCASLN